MIVMRYAEPHIPVDPVLRARVVLAGIAYVAIFWVAAVWISLWAINKPVHPDACGNYRGAECAAAVSK